jgi:hypothetical protein
MPTRRKAHKSSWQTSGKRRPAVLREATDRVLDPAWPAGWCGAPAGIEPATPSLPSMVGWFAPPCSTSCDHTIAHVEGAAEKRGVGRREAACSAVSGKSLAWAPAWSSMAWTPASSSRSLAPNRFRAGARALRWCGGDGGAQPRFLGTRSAFPLGQARVRGPRGPSAGEPSDNSANAGGPSAHLNNSSRLIAATPRLERARRRPSATDLASA